MAIDSLAEHLLALEVFQDLGDDQLNEIARRAERIIYKPGQLLIADGEPGDAAVIVIAGDAVRTKGHLTGAEHEPVEPGCLLGEMTMLIETEYSSTVVANTPVRALRIPRQAMIELMLADRTLAEHFVQKIARRLNRLASELRVIEATLDSIELKQVAATDDQTNRESYSPEPSHMAALSPPA